MQNPKTASQRKAAAHIHNGETRDLSDLALHACRIASDAAFNIREFFNNSSRMAYLAVRDCEKELDRIEQEMDQRMPAAITHVNELQARELLACLRFSTELERIGDLLWGAAQRTQNLRERLHKSEAKQFTAMVLILETQLHNVCDGFEDRDLDLAGEVVRADREMDRLYKSLFRRRLLTDDEAALQQNADIFLIAQALERTGDHATNLAEELYRLIEGRSLRHVPKRETRD